MSWQTAHDKIVSIVAGTTPSSTSRGKAAKFKHVPRANETALGGDRTFFISVDSVEGSAPYTPTFSSVRRDAKASLIIRYRDDVDGDALDGLMMQDHLSIAKRVLDVANWNPNSSRLIRIGDGGPPWLPATFDDVKGARLMRIQLNVQFD